ncbi:CPBP family glutamic-type intramembrane protease [Tellurirhabdus bombi]|uniref:CPBP family glutamic-type intramembrane protease n=1 Tax=Tellurirhabdus bombi TaxID=2907205 RepID=UPI001F280874|nr:CPBP family glutamic-type intramembrane protease [Tellurirhabdus bombi]
MKPSRSIYTDFLSYVKNPGYVQPVNVVGFSKVTLFIRLFLTQCPFWLGSGFLAAFVVLQFEKWTGADLRQHHAIHGWSFFVAAVLIVPLVEETMFRFSLQLTPGRLASALSIMLLLVLFRLYNNLSSATPQYLVVGIFAMWSLASYLLVKWIRQPRLFGRIEAFWRQHFRVIYYLSAFSFGFFHLSNCVELSVWHLALAPLITLPQIVLGFYQGYVRMTYGFWYAVGLHMLVNLGPVTLMMTSQFN